MIENGIFADKSVILMESQITEYKQQWSDKFLSYVSGFVNVHGCQMTHNPIDRINN